MQRNAGVFEIFESVFADDAGAEYEKYAIKSSNGKKAAESGTLDEYYLQWRTYQMSDHKPMWVRLAINDSAAYLDALASG